ncbi:putative CRM domain-containing protein [Helianthus annuus]|nr:putative CRM domain-containing protein [Helianthus annuus]KAJ0826032.1 putative CRM domain-containing protein [Helianthus annuus]
MFATKNLQKRCFQTLTSRFITNYSKDVKLLTDVTTNLKPSYAVVRSEFGIRDDNWLWSSFDGRRMYSTSKGRSMRSKVEMRMKKESGKTLREIQRAKKLQKKLMTDEERLIYNLKRAKKKVALLLQKLKKYELPELPPPRHDPELLTPEQIQALKKIGFRNRNYVPVGVRGVFGGVVQNMHMHWKFHETVQVCCDNFPKEKIKEMATMLARLSGGIVVNIHNVKTIIMFRGRNYRQPKNLIPINTLTKRKALFKARFEQALDSQKLNIKKIEQQLRRMNINPDDPVAMASIQRVASTFFNAIDKKEGSPYVFQGEKHSGPGPATVNIKEPESGEDSDQEELDKFIAEIEDAADKEWEVEEAAEKEEVNRIRYLYREDYDGRYTKPGMGRMAPQRGGGSENDEVDDDGDEVDSDEGPSYDVPKVERWKSGKNGRAANGGRFNSRDEEESESEDVLDDLENIMFESDEENESKSSIKATNYENERKEKTTKNADEDWDSD